MTGARDPAGRVILVLVTVLGVWLGLTAPATSPVDPAPAVQTTITTQVGLP